MKLEKWQELAKVAAALGVRTFGQLQRLKEQTNASTNAEMAAALATFKNLIKGS